MVKLVLVGPPKKATEEGHASKLRPFMANECFEVVGREGEREREEKKQKKVEAQRYDNISIPGRVIYLCFVCRGPTNEARAHPCAHWIGGWL